MGESQGTTYLIQVYDHQINFEANRLIHYWRLLTKNSTYLLHHDIKIQSKDFTDTLVPLNSRFSPCWT